MARNALPPDGGGLTPRVSGFASPQRFQHLSSAESISSSFTGQARGDQRVGRPAPASITSPGRLQRLYGRASVIATDLAYRETQRAGLACDPSEQTELRENAKIFECLARAFGWEAVR
jgi:hypothetical protein